MFYIQGKTYVRMPDFVTVILEYGLLKPVSATSARLSPMALAALLRKPQSASET